MFGKEGWGQNCEKGLENQLRNLGFILSAGGAKQRLVSVNCAFSEDGSAGGMEEGRGQGTPEEGTQTETVVSSRMARLCLREVVASETPLQQTCSLTGCRGETTHGAGA